MSALRKEMGLALAAYEHSVCKDQKIEVGTAKSMKWVRSIMDSAADRIEKLEEENADLIETDNKNFDIIQKFQKQFTVEQLEKLQAELESEIL